MPTVADQLEAAISQLFNAYNRGSFQLPVGHDQPPAGPSKFLQEHRFARLARAWKRETRYESSLTRIITHHAYQAIVGMGEVVVPLILEDLRIHGGHWFWALHAITQADPAKPGDDFEAMRSAWLKWGAENRYI